MPSKELHGFIQQRLVSSESGCSSLPSTQFMDINEERHRTPPPPVTVDEVTTRPARSLSSILDPEAA
jgi:hypothetical protein